MPPPPPQQHGHQVSIWQKSLWTRNFFLWVLLTYILFRQFPVKMGALMGGGVGLTIGFIFGSWSIIRHGAGPRGFMATLSQYMLSSAATFSFFLSIGSVIRSDASQLQAMQMQVAGNPVLQSKFYGAQLIRSRWEQERQRQASSQ